MKPAFSTVACPEWTFAQLAEKAENWGYLGCELRSFGYGSTQFACDPALTSPAKARLLLERAGVELVSVGTSIRYDEPISPPVLGMIFADTERSVRESKGAIDLAVRLECPFVRVFGFEIVGSESRKSALARIASRLSKAADHARNSGVQLLVENGGSFSTAVQLAELIDAVDSELLSAAYSIPVALQAGEKVADGANVLGERLAMVKVRDFSHGLPCALGQGEIDNRGAIDALAAAGFDGWVVYEYDRAWVKAEDGHAAPDLDTVMKQSAQTLFEWIGKDGALPQAARRCAGGAAAGVVTLAPVQLGKEIVERCRAMGFAAAGIAPVETSRWREEVLAWLGAGRQGTMEYLAKDLELKFDPARVLEGTRAFIVVADLYAGRGENHPRLADSAPPPQGRKGIGRVARYAQGKNYHWVIKNRLHALADQLRIEHPGAMFRTFVDTVPVLERELAELAGIGWQGKNTMVINARLGSYLLLGGVATTLELLPPPEQVRSPDHCGTCTRCIDACPTRAITPYSVDGSRCISYLTIEHREAIDPALHGAMGDWVYGCDICQEVCPHNSARETLDAGERNPAYESKHPTLGLLEILGWDKQSRREAFTSTAMKRANLAMMKRNAIIAAGNWLRRAEDAGLRARLVEVAADMNEPEMVRATARDVLSKQ